MPAQSWVVYAVAGAQHQDTCTGRRRECLVREPGQQVFDKSDVRGDVVHVVRETLQIKPPVGRFLADAEQEVTGFALVVLRDSAADGLLLRSAYPVEEVVGEQVVHEGPGGDLVHDEPVEQPLQNTVEVRGIGHHLAQWIQPGRLAHYGDDLGEFLLRRRQVLEEQLDPAGEVRGVGGQQVQSVGKAATVFQAGEVTHRLGNAVPGLVPHLVGQRVR